jgi:vacuolar-type H+-ATPase subunit I/STV1
MGNSYSLLNEILTKSDITCCASNLSEEEAKKCKLKEEVMKLEENIKKVDDVLEILCKKCDKIVTKVVGLENKTYELIETIKVDRDVGNWDYYDLKSS